MHKEKDKITRERKNKLINAKYNSIASKVCYIHIVEVSTVIQYPSFILQTAQKISQQNL